MIFWLYAKHHWPPSAYIKMTPNERRVLQAFYLQEQKELKDAQKKIEEAGKVGEVAYGKYN